VIQSKFVISSIKAAGLFILALAGAAVSAQASHLGGRNVLAGTNWQECHFAHGHTDRKTGQEVKVYMRSITSFAVDGKYKNRVEGYALDPSCSTPVDFGQVVTYDPEATPIGDLAVGTYEVTPLSSSTSDVYALDLHLSKPEGVEFYTSIKLTGETLLISDRCQNDAYIKEGLCEKIDGFTREERANHLDNPSMVMDSLSRIK
jgi:hypothetical protein